MISPELLNNPLEHVSPMTTVYSDLRNTQFSDFSKLFNENNNRFPTCNENINLKSFTSITPKPCDIISHENRGTSLCNIRALLHRNRFPTGDSKIPLLSLCGTTSFVSFKILPSSDTCGLITQKNTKWFRVNMLCFEQQNSVKPKFVIPLYECQMIAKTCTEFGPSLYLTTKTSHYQFQCENTGPFNYQFWETQMTLLGVKLTMPHDLFVSTSSQPIGEGSFAKVFTAINRKTGLLVVIKRIPKRTLPTLPKNYLSAVEIEISILRKISHPHIVQFELAFEDDSFYYIVLEKLRGGTVKQWLRQNKRMSENQAKTAILRILSVLSCLESNNIVHRDLKLENLVLKDSSDPTSFKIIDFGLASYLKTPRMNMFCGSPGFVAPEIIAKKSYGTRVDMFSAGVLLYAFLLGNSPFNTNGDTASKTLYKNKLCNITFDDRIWNHYSPEVKDFLAKLLHKDPKKRLSVNDALQHEWITCKNLSTIYDVTETPVFRYKNKTHPIVNTDIDSHIKLSLNHNETNRKPLHHKKTYSINRTVKNNKIVNDISSFKQNNTHLNPMISTTNYGLMNYQDKIYQPQDHKTNSIQTPRKSDKTLFDLPINYINHNGLFMAYPQQLECN